MTVTKGNIGDLLVKYRVASKLADAHLANYLRNDDASELRCSNDYDQEMRGIEAAIKAALPDVDNPDGTGQ